MNCSKHGDKESVAKCIECGRAMCEQCAQEGEKLIPKRRMCADCCKKVLQEERKEAKIVCIVVAIKNGAVIRKIDARLSAASAGAASSATISGASKNI